MRSESNDYEVRCPRCEVSFPVEIKVCLHCGGRTGPGDQAHAAKPFFDFNSDSDTESGVVDTGFDAPFSSEQTDDSEAFVIAPPEDTIAIETRDESSSPAGVGRSILGSMGSLIWVAMLIAFSVYSQLCGGE